MKKHFSIYEIPKDEWSEFIFFWLYSSYDWNVAGRYFILIKSGKACISARMSIKGRKKR